MFSASILRSFSLGRNTPSDALLPPSPTTVTIIHDNFNGATGTSLLSHTPDIGGAWLDYINTEYPDFTADAFSLDGLGNAYLDTYGWNKEGAVYNATTSSTSNFIIEADFEIKQSLQGYSQVFFLFKGDPVISWETDWDLRFSQMEMYIQNSGYAFVGLGSRQLDGNSIYNVTPEEAEIDVSVGTHQIKLVVNGLSLSAYYDNILVGARTVDALDTGSHFGFSMWTSGDLDVWGLSNFIVKEVIN